MREDYHDTTISFGEPPKSGFHRSASATHLKVISRLSLSSFPSTARDVLLHRPPGRNERLPVPPAFHDGFAEPRLVQLGVVGDDDLQTSLQVRDTLIDPPEQ